MENKMEQEEIINAIFKAVTKDIEATIVSYFFDEYIRALKYITEEYPATMLFIRNKLGITGYSREDAIKIIKYFFSFADNNDILKKYGITSEDLLNEFRKRKNSKS